MTTHDFSLARARRAPIGRENQFTYLEATVWARLFVEPAESDQIADASIELV